MSNADAKLERREADHVDPTASPLAAKVSKPRCTIYAAHGPPVWSRTGPDSDCPSALLTRTRQRSGYGTYDG